MRFRIRHLLFVVAVFAVSLASGFPCSLADPEGIWQVVAIDRVDGSGGEWSHLHPGLGSRPGVERQDFIATIRNGYQTQTINLGDTAVLAMHRLKLPQVGSYVAMRGESTRSHGALPVAAVEGPSRFRLLFAVTGSFLFSVVVVIGCLAMIRSARKQAVFYAECRVIDESAA